MSRVFVGVAGPLFLTGIVLGYVTLPVALEVLIGFNPDGVTNLIDFNDYLQFFTRTLFVFGLAFNIPVFVVLLNFAGVVKGSALKAYRPWIVIGTFIFAAVATPSGDPWTMTALAVPMLVLFATAASLCLILDKRRRQRGVDGIDYSTLDDDLASPVDDDAASPLDERPTPLDDGPGSRRNDDDIT